MRRSPGLLHVVLGLDAPDAGTATIGGRPYRALQNPLRHVGSLLDAGALQPSRSARHHLLWLAHSQGLKAGQGCSAVTLLVDMHAVEAIASLEQLAERDERIVIAAIDDDIAWQDEKLQEQLRASVAALRAA
jgi:hypothetical protein